MCLNIAPIFGGLPVLTRVGMALDSCLIALIRNAQYWFVQAHLPTGGFRIMRKPN